MVDKKMKRYEKEKSKLEKQNLSSKEYQRKIKDIARKCGI